LVLRVTNNRFKQNQRLTNWCQAAPRNTGATPDFLYLFLRAVPVALILDAPLNSDSGGCLMQNDTAVFDAMKVDVFTGESEWTRLAGVREAIERDGYVVDPSSLRYCPHEWINGRGYVDPGLARKYPHPTKPDRALFQKIDIVRGGVPPRDAIDAMLLTPTGTDIPISWIGELSIAREAFDRADNLPDGSRPRSLFIELGSDIEERAVAALSI
jgi:hypothetical protein